MDTFSEVAKEFSDYEAFLRSFHAFCEEKYEPLTISSNNKKQVTILCHHGVKRALYSTGVWSHLGYNYLACGAKITCYKPANSTTIRIISVNLDHNHEVSEKAFRRVP